MNINYILVSMWLRLGLRLSRFYSSVSSSPLAVLRKKTGYQLSKCKEALSLHNSDLSLAEEWLREQARKEGWIKADLPRATTQGVIAACVDGNAATMLEVRRMAIVLLINLLINYLNLL